MAQTSRLQHDVKVAERATASFVVGIVLAAFFVLALGTTVYDIGKWLTVW